MASLSNIKKSASTTGAWLGNKQALHTQMVENSIKNLQKEILGSLDILQTTKGKLEGVTVNMKQARAVHKDILKSFDKYFTTETRKIINDFDSTMKIIDKSFGILDESVKFTGADKVMMNTLKKGNYQEYLNLGNQYQNQVSQSVYNAVIGGGSFSELQTTIRAALVGSAAKSAAGRSLAQYSRLYARDMINNFHQEVNLKKAEDVGMKHFLYYGTVIASSRDFCKRRVGKTYTKDQINSWKYKWVGKSGPALTHRGGYNCRHHWQAVRKEWIEKYGDTEMQDYFKETGKKVTPKIKPTWQKTTPPKPVKPKPAKPVPPVKPKPVVKPKPKPKPKPVVIKDTMPTMDQIKDQMTIAQLEGSVSKLKDKYDAAVIKYTKVENIYSKAAKSYSSYDKIGTVEAKRLARAAQEAGADVVEARRLRNAANAAYKEGRAAALNDVIRPKVTGQADLYFPNRSGSKAVQKTRANNVAFMKSEIEKMFHKNVIDTVPELGLDFRKGQRAFHKHLTNEIGFGSFKDVKTMVHEFAHAVERSLPRARRAALNFRSRRIGNEKISIIYKGTNERGWKDEFFSHYCGKDYGGSATEIISMGVEKMYVDPVDFLKKDPDYFEFILKIMWGEI